MNSGYEYAICSAIAGGCWQPLMKACHKTDAAFCNLYFNAGMFICAWAALSLTQHVYIFTCWGLASGFILVTAQAVNFTVLIPVFGIAKATGIISGVAIVASVGWNIILDEKMANTKLTFLGVGVVLLGLYGIILSKSEVESKDKDGKSATASLKSIDGKEEPFLITATEEGSDGTTKVSKSQADIEKEWSEFFSMAHAVTISIFTGILAGSVLVPMTYADEEFQGLVFIPSVAIGCLGTVLPVSYIQLAIEGNASWKSIYEKCNFSETFIPAGAAGAVYAVAMGTNIEAIEHLDYATAMVIMQSAIVVAGTWGIVLYGELKGWSAVKFYASSLVLLCGAVLVAINGTTK